MSIHQTIYDTLNLPLNEVVELVGAGDPRTVVLRRERMEAFLKSHKWSLAGYKSWLADGAWTPDQKARGIGDVVAKVTHAIQLKGCAPCVERQKKLNKVWGFK